MSISQVVSHWLFENEVFHVGKGNKQMNYPKKESQILSAFIGANSSQITFLSQEET